MSTPELEQFKALRINELTQRFNVAVARLNATLSTNLRQLKVQQPARINAFIATYNRDLATLRAQYAAAVRGVQSFVPPSNSGSRTGCKRALLIGINYLGTACELGGCIDDVARMQTALIERGVAPANIQILTDTTPVKPTRTVLLRELQRAIAACNPGDILFLYYSGHGSYQYDTSGDEPDGRDECLVGMDLAAISDDELNRLLASARGTIVAMFDACHSGTILDLKYTYLDCEQRQQLTDNMLATDCSGSNLLMVSGCTDSQTSAEAWIDNQPQGALTWAWLQCWKTNPRCSWRTMLQTMRTLLKEGQYTQIPQLSSNNYWDLDSPMCI